MRILHLIDPAAPGGGPCTLKLLAETLTRVGGRHDVLIVGTTDHVALARRCGLKPLGRIRAPLNRPALARSAIRRVLLHRERHGGRYDLIHAWTLSAAVSVARMMLKRPVLASAAAGSRIVGRDVRVLARRGVPVLAATTATRDRLLGAGYPPDLVAVVPPAVDPASIAMEQRRLIRESWGADETTFVVAHLGEPGPTTDGEHALLAAARAALTGKDFRIIIQHRAATPAKHVMLLRAGLSDLIVVDERVAEPWRVAAGFDAACTLYRPPRRDRSRSPQLPGPLLWAMAAGVPVIAEQRDAGDWLVEGSTGLVTDTGDSNRTAARLLDLFDDAAFARRVGAAGKALVAQRFAPDAFARRIAAAWEAAAVAEAARPPLQSCIDSQSSGADKLPLPRSDRTTSTTGCQVP